MLSLESELLRRVCILLWDGLSGADGRKTAQDGKVESAHGSCFNYTHGRHPLINVLRIKLPRLCYTRCIGV